MPITTQTNFQVDAQLPRFEFDVVNDIAARDAIPSINRFEGLESFVKSDETKYRLQGGVANADWVATGGGGSSNTFENALTESGGVVKLGGDLTGPTSIAGNNNFLTLGSAISPLPFLESNWDFWIHTANNFAGTPTTMSYSGQGIILNLGDPGNGSSGSFGVGQTTLGYQGGFPGGPSATFNVNGNETTLVNSNGAFVSTVRFKGDDGVIVQTTSNKGISLDADYSANFTDLSLVNKGFVDSNFTSSYEETFTASSGTTVTASTHGFASVVSAEVYEDDGTSYNSSSAAISINKTTLDVSWSNGSAIDGKIVIFGKVA